MTEQYSSFVSVCIELLVFLDVIFSIGIFFNKVIQKSDFYWVLALDCTDPKLSKSEKILMSLNSKQKRLFQLATAELFQRDREAAKKWKKRAWVWCLKLAVLSLYNHAKRYFLAWWSLTAQVKSPFQDSKELKMNLRIAIFQERLSTLSIRYIKSDKLKQTNCNQFLDNFVMKKAGQNL